MDFELVAREFYDYLRQLVEDNRIRALKNGVEINWALIHGAEKILAKYTKLIELPAGAIFINDLPVWMVSSDVVFPDGLSDGPPQPVVSDPNQLN